MPRDPEHEVRELGRFAAEVYLLADASFPDHLNWQVRFYDEPLHATSRPAVELRVWGSPARGRRIVWYPELVVYNEHESAWPGIIRDAIDKLRHDLSV